MAELARLAGVDSATLYRNFANRRELPEALYVNEIDAVCAAAATIDGENAGAIFTSWLHRFCAYFTSKRLVAAELLEHTGADAPVFSAGFVRVITAGQPLLAAARPSGQVRDDLDLEQILALIVAVAKTPRDDDFRAPILQAALDALRPVGIC